MNAPPMIMKMRIKKRGHRGIWLWLPLFLVYLPLFLLALVLLPVILIVAIVLIPWGLSRTLFLMLPRFYAVLCALKELEVDVEDNKQGFYISFK